MSAIKDIHTHFNHALNVLLDFAELMLSSGAEVNRVEDSLSRIGISYGASKMNVFAITSNVIVTMIDHAGNAHTQSRRFASSAHTDFYKLEQLNALSREKCSGQISEESFEEKISIIKAIRPSKYKIYAGSMLAAGAFAVFFGGTLTDAIAAVVFAVLIYFMQNRFQRFCPNTIMFNLITSFLVGIGICLTAKICGLNADKIIIGDIMLLIPGIAFTNAIRNLLVGDTNTGVMRFVETILWAAALAFGFVLSIMLIGV